MIRNPNMTAATPITGRKLTRDEYIMYLAAQDYHGTDMNCWFLVQNIQAYVYGVIMDVVLHTDEGIVVPGSKERAYLFNKHPERKLWQRAEAPTDGAIILTARRATPPDYYQHAGVYVAIDEGFIVHFDEHHGVALDPVWMFKEFRNWNEPHYFVRKPSANTPSPPNDGSISSAL